MQLPQISMLAEAYLNTLSGEKMVARHGTNLSITLSDRYDPRSGKYYRLKKD